MENPIWVDGQKSILEQKSMSMEEEKDTSWEARLNKQFFGGVPIDEMGSNQIEESELQGFILSERKAAKEEEREKSRIERKALLREIVDGVKGLSNEVPTGKVCDYENLDLRIYCDGRDDAFTEVQELIKKKI